MARGQSPTARGCEHSDREVCAHCWPRFVQSWHNRQSGPVRLSTAALEMLAVGRAALDHDQDVFSTALDWVLVIADVRDRVGAGWVGLSLGLGHSEQDRIVEEVLSKYAAYPEHSPLVVSWFPCSATVQLAWSLGVDVPADWSNGLGHRPPPGFVRTILQGDGLGMLVAVDYTSVPRRPGLCIRLATIGDGADAS